MPGTEPGVSAEPGDLGRAVCHREGWLMSNSAAGTAHPTRLPVKLERGASLSVGTQGLYI